MVKPQEKKDAHSFYREAILLLQESGADFLLGGAFATFHYTGVYRDTKDLDIFCRSSEYPKILKHFAAKGFHTELTDVRWLAKVFKGEFFMDVIFDSVNHICTVDDAWYAHSTQGEFEGLPVRMIPAEELIWCKTYVQNRERFDGADVNHMLLKYGRKLDWERLLKRLDHHWHLFLANILVFQFVYPSDYPEIAEFLVRHSIDSLSLNPDAVLKTTLTVLEAEARRSTELVARLELAETRYRELIERLPVVSYLAEYGPEGRWLYVSPQIESLLGFPPQRWLDDSNLWWSRVHPDDRERVCEEEELCARNLSPLSLEYRMIAADGRIVWIRDEGALGRPGDGGVVRVEGVMTDVSERRRAEAGVCFASSEMSAPATKPRPAPVRITPPTSSRPRSSSTIADSSTNGASFSALSFSGRLKVTVAMRSATSRVRSW